MMRPLLAILILLLFASGLEETTARSRKKGRSTKRSQLARTRSAASRSSSSQSATSASSASSEATRTNLLRLRASIESTRKRIDALQRQESSTIRSLSSVQRKRQQVNEIVRNLEADLHALQDSVTVLESRIRSTSSARERAESAYSDLAFAAIVHDAERGVTTSSDGPGDEFLVQHATSQMRQHRNRMLNRQDSLSNEQELFVSTSSEHALKLRERAAEERRLAGTISTRQQELERIRGDKSLLLKELAAKRSSANTLTSMIRRQEEISRAREAQRRKEIDARKRQEQASAKGQVPGRAKNDHTSSADDDRASAGGSASSAVGGFAANSLPWPTQSRALIHGYGVYKNRETGTTLDNPGLDIRSPIGSRMTCVAAGVVSSVTWLPGFGSLVIVDHGNGFRTVYANLTSASVGVGAAVRAGTVIGSSGESIDGPTAHFEVWRGRERQNPLTYLR